MTSAASKDERAIYLALRTIFKNQHAMLRRQSKINGLINEHKTQPAIANLIREHGFAAVSETTKQLLSDRIFESTLLANSRFSKLSTTMDGSVQTALRPELPKLSLHHGLLELQDHRTEDGNEIMTTPIFSESIRNYGESLPQSPFTQYGLLGGETSKMSKVVTGSPVSAEENPSIYYNISAPSSVFVCGSQGSGKSHTLSCLLENCLLPSEANVLPRPLSGIVFHYDLFVSDTAGSPCEAAYLSSHRGIQVRVLCPPTNVKQLKRTYSFLANVDVEELRLKESDLNTKRMLDLMAVSSVQGGGMPLYLHVVTRILRELRISQQASDESFNYTAFKRALDKEDLSPAQRSPLQQRLDTLQSFMVKQQVATGRLSTKKGSAQPSGTKEIDWSPRPGQLTIIDLSCPCVTAEAACALFNVCLGLFLEQDTSVGRVVALDEAHKYMTDTTECEILTEYLLSTIRLQRHIGTRVIISTQEPTISPKLLDLCSITIVHRFTSPDWLRVLKQHLAGATALGQAVELPEESNEQDWTSQDRTFRSPLKNIEMELFMKIVGLRTGEALVFAPSAVIKVQEQQEGFLLNATGTPGSFPEVLESSSSASNAPVNGLKADARPTRLTCGFLKIRVRKRITKDGGRTIMAV